MMDDRHSTGPEEHDMDDRPILARIEQPAAEEERR